MTMQTYVIRSFAEDLLEKGHDKDEVIQAIESAFGYDDELIPTGKCYYIRYL
jgi:hypothetical protein